MFGYFSILKGIFENIMIVVGGVLSERITVSTAYLILSIYPILVLAYIFFYFKEEKVSKYLTVNWLDTTARGSVAQSKNWSQRPIQIVPETRLRTALAVLHLKRDFPPEFLRFHAICARKKTTVQSIDYHHDRQHRQNLPSDRLHLAY